MHVESGETQRCIHVCRRSCTWRTAGFGCVFVLCVYELPSQAVGSTEPQGRLGGCPLSWHNFVTRKPQTPHVTSHESSSPATFICMALYFRILGMWLMLNQMFDAYGSRINFIEFFSFLKETCWEKRKKLFLKSSGSYSIVSNHSSAVSLSNTHKNSRLLWLYTAIAKNSLIGDFKI